LRERTVAASLVFGMFEIRCPVCEQTFDARHSPSMPFCSERCREIDLRRWLDERYGLPIEREEVPDFSREEPAD
jgi:endogenous inhibitor of DNA gyrase (YacG/DUF329 family)